MDYMGFKNKEDMKLERNSDGGKYGRNLKGGNGVDLVKTHLQARQFQSMKTKFL